MERCGEVVGEASAMESLVERCGGDVALHPESEMAFDIEWFSTPAGNSDSASDSDSRGTARAKQI